MELEKGKKRGQCGVGRRRAVRNKACQRGGGVTVGGGHSRAWMRQATARVARRQGHDKEAGRRAAVGHGEAGVRAFESWMEWDASGEKGIRFWLLAAQGFERGKKKPNRPKYCHMRALSQLSCAIAH